MGTFPVVRDAMEGPPVVENEAEGKRVVGCGGDVPETTLVPLKDGRLREEVTAEPVEGTVAIKGRIRSQVLHDGGGRNTGYGLGYEMGGERLR